MITDKSTTTIEIENIFKENKVHDLKRFMEQREQLNKYNIWIRYVFIFSHYSAILITTFAVGYQGNVPQQTNEQSVVLMKNMVWAGIGINVFATILTALERMNKSMSKKLLNNIKEIKSGNYVDETMLVESYHSQNTPKSSNKKTKRIFP